MIDNGEFHKDRGCICRDSRCYQLMKAFHGFDDIDSKNRCGWITIPSLPKPIKRPHKKDQLRADIKKHHRNRILTHLKVVEGGLGDRNHVALVHFHPYVLNEFGETQRGITFPKSISITLARHLNKGGFSYTDIDRVDASSPDSEYLAVPNYPLSNAVEDLQKLGGSLNNISVKKSRIGVDERLLQKETKEDPNKTVKKCLNLDEKVGELAKQLMLEKKESDERELHKITDAKALTSRAAHEFEQFILNRGGLCRENITSDDWHDKHPEQANHLFGFRNWKETKAYVWSMFPEIMKSREVPKGVEKAIHQQDNDVSEFEKCLLAKMRIHRGYPEKTLGAMYNRSEAAISRYLSEWVPQWGEAGEHLSILDITEEYLCFSMPEPFKEAGLQNVCCMPDGKDFMVHTPRSNTLLSRAARSDKVKSMMLLILLC